MLRYYEGHDLIAPDRRNSGYRDNDQALVERADKIRCFVEAGVPVRTIAKMLDGIDTAGPKSGGNMTADLRAMLAQAHDRVVARIAALAKNRASLAHVIAYMDVPTT
jgi:DNA-binding transcriptional MerR regulator